MQNLFFLVTNNLEYRHLIIIEMSSEENDTSGLMQTEGRKVDTFVEVFLYLTCLLVLGKTIQQCLLC